MGGDSFVCKKAGRSRASTGPQTTCQPVRSWSWSCLIPVAANCGRITRRWLTFSAMPLVLRTETASRPPLDASDFQAVERDFAFVVDAEVEAETLLRAARGAEKALIESASVFDVFDGPRAAQALGEGRKSLALSVRLQPRKGTLTDEEIEAVAAKVVAAVEKASGGTLRA